MQEEARKEVLSVVGRDGSIDDAALQKMSFIKSCLKESTRFVLLCILSKRERHGHQSGIRIS